LDTVKSLLQTTSLDRIDAKVLMHSVCLKHLGWSKEQLISKDNEALPQEVIDAWKCFALARTAGTPVAYLTETKAFYNIDLYVNPAVLIPRPETELLVESAIKQITSALKSKVFSKDKPLCIIDLGTGSGAIILALARYFQEQGLADLIAFTATDISDQALEVARHNARELSLSFVDFIKSDWFSDLRQVRFDVIISNPPYIASDDHHLLQGDLRFEPPSALTDGADGLQAYRILIRDSVGFLNPRGVVLLEHGYQQKSALQSLLLQYGYSGLQTLTDLGGNDRVTIGYRQ
jgi:release factor glutamine methyltransferase